jgi:hypothetical protein
LFYWIFIPCDFFSLSIQAIGGGLSTLSHGQSVIGVDLALVGLAFQVFTIVIFCGFFADYLVRYSRVEHQVGHRILTRRLNLFFGFLLLAILLITVRCVYRLVELNQGYSGHFVREEPLFIGLEGMYVSVS